MSVTVDISEVIRGTRVATRTLEEWPTDFEITLRRAAEVERATHKYKNQTTHLEESTKAALVEQTDNRIEVELTMGEQYASYVVKRGFSKFPRIATRAEADLNREAAAVASKLGKL
jgi:hypothetical protein